MCTMWLMYSEECKNWTSSIGQQNSRIMYIGQGSWNEEDKYHSTIRCLARRAPWHVGSWAYTLTFSTLKISDFLSSPRVHTVRYRTDVGFQPFCREAKTDYFFCHLSKWQPSKVHKLDKTHTCEHIIRLCERTQECRVTEYVLAAGLLLKIDLQFWNLCTYVFAETKKPGRCKKVSTYFDSDTRGKK